MSLAIIFSRALMGIDSPLVTVETHLSNGLPGFSIVGLPEAAVRESKDRVRSALLNTNFEFPIDKIIINLAPADLPKEGGRFDLPIALGILAASHQLPIDLLAEYEFVGELALSGELRPIQGALPFAIQTKKAKRKLIIPADNANEAALVQDLDIFPAQHIIDVFAHLTNKKVIEPYAKNSDHEIRLTDITSDMSEVKGQHHAKKALEISAAGEHSILLMGPPGTGKTMLASRMPTILPTMTEKEAIEIAAINSISHQGFQMHRWKKRPFRAPHHSASSVALVGGGNPPRPGEISLAHQGVLFLDELPEFNRHVLEALREPLESGTITISRAARQSEFPAQFQLIAAMNPCPCGYLGDPQGHCRCTADQIQRYRQRISGPILDRIDMHVEVPRLPVTLLSSFKDDEEKSTPIRSRVEAARFIQLERTQKSNAQLSSKEIAQHCQLQPDEKKLLDQAIEKLHLSARSYHRILRVARTVADLAKSEIILRQHLLEALSYRKID